MRKRSNAVTCGVAAAVIALCSGGCPQNTDGSGNENVNDNESVALVAEVFINGFAFVPKEVTIKKGGTVHWRNQDPAAHTVTSGNPGDADAGATFDSGEIQPGDSFPLTFDSAGEYTYFCELHPGLAAMRDAKVIVVE
ncbi:MAG: Plastocyanin [Phycisphaerae bacterium]|nr:Plastocyanin [Phycisphaerae bacterium]